MGSLLIGVTGVAGANSGSVQVQLATNGSGTSGLGTLNLGAAQTVSVSGTGHTTAQATVQSAVNFGIVHVGQVVAAQGVSVQNSAPVTALNDTLNASISGAASPFSSSGSVTGLVAGAAANTAALSVGLNTTTAGVYSGSATVASTSHNADMADLGLGNQTVTLNATVNKFANAVFHELSGGASLTRSGNLFTLDFGTVAQGSGSLGAHVDIQNLVAGGPADFLSGSLNVTDGNEFATTLLLSTFSGVGADLFSGDALSLLFNTNTLGLGLHQDTVDLIWHGSNASGYVGPDSSPYTLRVIGNISARGTAVPEPGSLLLMTIALAGLGFSRRRKSA